MLNKNNFLQKRIMNVFVVMAFVSIILGSFYSAILSPERKSKSLINQAYGLYSQASDSQNSIEIYKLLDGAQTLAQRALQYNPDDKILNQEEAFFQSARHEMNDYKIHFSDASSDSKIK